MSERERRREARRREGVALSNEAAGYLRQGKPEKALPLLRQAVERLPDDTGVLLNLGGAYVLLGRYVEATAVLERASQLAPDEPMVWCNLGAALLRFSATCTDEDRERAIDAFRRALELDPKAANVAYNLGLIYRDRADWAEAAHYFSLALVANPEDADARGLLEKMQLLMTAGLAGGVAGDRDDATTVAPG